MKKFNLSPKIFITLVLLFIYIPILIVVIFSFNSEQSLHTFSGFSFRWYKELFSNERLIRAVYITLLVSVISTIVSTILGTFGAIFLSKTGKKFKELALSANNIPIVNPEIVTAIGLFLLFYGFSLSPGITSMILAHIAFSTPYVIVAVYPKIKSLDPSLIDAAYDLGAKPYQALFKVILPQLKPAIIAGAAIAFTMSFDDYIITKFVTDGNNDVQNISQYLFANSRFGVSPVVNALSTIIFVVVLSKVVYDLIKFKKQNKKVEA